MSDIRAKIAARLNNRFNQQNMDVCLEGGGFFCRRDNASIDAILCGMREAFFAGFRRSDSPPPSEQRIEAAWEDWLQRS
jgi:hypothetical protein